MKVYSRGCPKVKVYFCVLYAVTNGCVSLAAVRLEFREDGSTGTGADGEEDFAKLERAAEAKRRAIEGDEEGVDEKTPADLKREYDDDDNEIVFL